MEIKENTTMETKKPVITLSTLDYDAVLFDLDGVLTRTAKVHATVWKKLLDEFLEQRATPSGTPFVPFDLVGRLQRSIAHPVVSGCSVTLALLRILARVVSAHHRG